MQFKLQDADSQTDDPHDVIAAQLRDLAPRRAHDPSGLNVAPPASPEPADEPTLRATPLNDNTGDIDHLTPRTGGRRGVMLIIVCAGIAVAAAWHSYGDEAKQRLSHLVPQLIPSATAPTQNADAAEPQGATSQAAASQPATEPPLAQETAAEVPARPATAPTASAVDTPPAQAELPPEITQSIESMAREIASLKQTVEQLQAGQQQLSRDVAKVTEQEARRKLATQTVKPAPTPRPQRTPTAAQRIPAPYSPPTYSQGQSYPQSAAQREAYIPPPAPTQLPPQPGDTSVPRPPMPLR